MAAIDIHVAEKRGAGHLRYDVHFEYGQADGTTRKDTIWFNLEGDVLPERVEVADFAVLSLLFMAMRLGYDMRVHGAVSRRLLANLEEFQAAWRLWRPETYRPIEIIPDREVDSTRPYRPDAVAAFSGGVDASFTLLRHSQGLAGRGGRRIAAALLIHGFDIPLVDKDAFNAAWEGSRRTLSTIDIPLSVVATNWREVVGHDWEAEFGCGLAACLHLFRDSAGAGLIGSDEDYAHLVLPWGSNPVTNWLLSSDDFEIVYDGGGFTRSDKVAFIAQWPGFADRLRVCWEGPATGANCGRCEKCLRTQMNFLAVNRTPGAAFPSSLRSGDVLRVRARNRVQLGYLKEIRATARKHGIRAPWVRCLEICIARDESLLGLRGALKQIPGLRSGYRRAGALLGRYRLARGSRLAS